MSRFTDALDAHIYGDLDPEWDNEANLYAERLQAELEARDECRPRLI